MNSNRSCIFRIACTVSSEFIVEQHCRTYFAWTFVGSPRTEIPRCRLARLRHVRAGYSGRICRLCR
jgi:hypothetical protein